MLTVVVKMSKLCNLRCVYCYEYEDLANKQRMDLAGYEFFIRNLARHLKETQFSEELHFSLHGGEPLLLPEEYLATVCDIHDRHLQPAGIDYRASCQSNLTTCNKKILDFLKSRQVGLGVSIDPFGEQRVTIAGDNSLELVADNLQMVMDHGVPVGAISVLHAKNVDRVLDTYGFFNDIGIDYRVLPIRNIHADDMPLRIKDLVLSVPQVLDAYKQIADEWLLSPSTINVVPLNSYLIAAVKNLAGVRDFTYDPTEREWVLILNTDGGMYNVGEVYDPTLFMGNVFKTDFTEVMNSEDRKKTVVRRLKRAATCRKCQFDGQCTQEYLVESFDNERIYDDAGELICSLVEPMIEHLQDLIKRTPQASAMIARLSGSAPVSARPESLVAL